MITLVLHRNKLADKNCADAWGGLSKRQAIWKRSATGWSAGGREWRAGHAGVTPVSVLTIDTTSGYFAYNRVGDLGSNRFCGCLRVVHSKLHVGLAAIATHQRHFAFTPFRKKR